MTGPIAPGAFLRYLPEVYWKAGDEANGTMSRLLKVFERVLFGLRWQTRAIRVSHPFDSATGNVITLASSDSAAEFVPGDTLTLEGTAERVRLDDVDGPHLILSSPLSSGPHGAGVVRIGDLVPGDRSFRLRDTGGLWPGAPVRLSQGSSAEAAVVETARGQRVTLRHGLRNTYALAADAVALWVRDGGADVTGDGTALPLDFRTQIDRIPTLFDPWRAPLAPPNAPREAYLEWLASFVALELDASWSMHKRRQLISDIAGIYRQRGLKAGLQTLIGIEELSAAAPRIVIDDGVAVWRLRPSPEPGLFALTEVARSSTLVAGSAEITSLLHPTGLAAADDGSLFVCDEGDGSIRAHDRPPALWRIGRAGEVAYRSTGPGGMPWPQPLHSGPPLDRPVAVVAESGRKSLVVLDSGSPRGDTDRISRLIRFETSDAGAAASVVIGPPQFTAIRPVDMALDPSGAFLVIDRGLHFFGDPPGTATGKTRLLIITEAPPVETVVDLREIVDPTAIAPDGAGGYLVADTADQATNDPADIWRIDPQRGWAPTSLLSGLPAGHNPIVKPVGLYAERPDSLLVIDAGVRNGWADDRTNRVVAEPPVVWRVSLSGAAPEISRAASGLGLVSPTKLARSHDGRLLIADRGDQLVARRSWRAGHNKYGVVVHFSQQRPTTFDIRNAALRDTLHLVNREGPAHTLAAINLETSMPPQGPISRNLFELNNAHAMEHHLWDYTNYFVPRDDLQNAHLRSWGICAGLEVRQVDAALEVEPGVAIDAKGKLIVLAQDGPCSIGGTLVGRPFRLSAARSPGLFAVAVRYFETVLRGQGAGGLCQVTPEISLLATGSFPNDGIHVILALVRVDAAGNFSDLSAFDEDTGLRRQFAGKPAGRLDLMRPAMRGDAAGFERAGSVTGRDAGGITIGVPGASDVVAVEREGGGGFASFKARTNTVWVHDRSGNQSLLLDAGAGSARLYIGSTGNGGNLEVRDPFGRRALAFDGSGATLNLGAEGNAGDLNVADGSSGQPRIQLRGSSGQVTATEFILDGQRIGDPVHRVKTKLISATRGITQDWKIDLLAEKDIFAFVSLVSIDPLDNFGEPNYVHATIFSVDDQPLPGWTSSWQGRGRVINYKMTSTGNAIAIALAVAFWA